jgi:hypothetical protein
MVVSHIALQLVQFLHCNLEITYWKLGPTTGYPHGSSSWLSFPLGNFHNRTQNNASISSGNTFSNLCSPRGGHGNKYNLIYFSPEIMPWLRRLFATCSLPWPRCHFWSVRLGFVIDEVALGQVFLLIYRFCPVNIITVSASLHTFLLLFQQLTASSKKQLYLNSPSQIWAFPFSVLLYKLCYSWRYYLCRNVDIGKRTISVFLWKWYGLADIRHRHLNLYATERGKENLPIAVALNLPSSNCVRYDTESPCNRGGLQNPSTYIRFLLH